MGVVLYRIFRRLRSGELLHIASRDSMGDVLTLISTFKSLWPEDAEYVVQDEHGTELELGD
jgi:hypothetical protein